MGSYSRTRNFNHFVRVSLFLLFVSVSNASFAMSLSSRTRATTLHVRIISSYKGQQVPVESNILVSGISSRAPAADGTHTNCNVSVLLNDMKPYQNAPATGQRGITDFSSWQNTITPKCEVVKRGQNKITSKISCRKPYKFDKVLQRECHRNRSSQWCDRAESLNGAIGSSFGGNGERA